MYVPDQTLLKVFIIGDSGVGKTRLMNQCVHKKFSQRYKATIGADFGTKKLQIEDHLLAFQIWDAPGQERFYSLGVALQWLHKGTDNERKSFHNLDDCQQQFLEQANPPDPETFPLVGNKIDINGGNSRVVSEKKALEWCASKGNIPYFETVKEDYNVDAAFLCVANVALLNEHE